MRINKIIGAFGNLKQIAEGVKNKIFKNMMDNVEKKEVDESKKKLPGESPSEYLKRISE